MAINKNLRRKSLIQIIGVFLLLFVFLTGCEEKQEVQKKAPVTASERKTQKVAAKKLEPEEVKVEFVYVTEGKRDPFKPFVKKKKVELIEQQTVPLTPLQRYDITQLKLTGIITSKDRLKSRAMVEDPVGKGYILKIGTLIGKNFGRVSNISSNLIIITEEIQDFLGNIVTKEIPLSLEIEEGE